jgi:hypothetical protein
MASEQALRNFGMMVADALTSDMRGVLGRICDLVVRSDVYLGWVEYQQRINGDLAEVQFLRSMLTDIWDNPDEVLGPGKRPIINSALVTVGEQEDVIMNLVRGNCSTLVFGSANLAASDAALAAAHGAFRQVFVDVVLGPVIEDIVIFCDYVEEVVNRSERFRLVSHRLRPGVWDRICQLTQMRDQLNGILAESQTPEAISHAIQTWDGRIRPMRDRRNAAFAICISVRSSFAGILADIEVSLGLEPNVGQIPESGWQEYLAARLEYIPDIGDAGADSDAGVEADTGVEVECDTEDGSDSDAGAEADGIVS